MNDVFVAIQRKRDGGVKLHNVVINQNPFRRLPGARNVVLCCSCVFRLHCDLQVGWIGVAVAQLEAALYMGLPQGWGWAGGLLCGIFAEVSGITWVQGWEVVLPQVASI